VNPYIDYVILYMDYVILSIDGLPEAVLVPLAGLGWYFTKSPTQGARTQVRLRDLRVLNASMNALRDIRLCRSSELRKGVQ
jgi:hypothetical protein